MLEKLHEANQVAALPAAVTVEQILAGVDVEGGAGFLVQGAESDELGASLVGEAAPVVPLQVLEQRYALFEPFQILAHGVYCPSSVRVRTCSSHSQARMVGGEKISALRGAGAKARRLAESKRGWAKTSTTSREPVARRGPAIARRLQECVAEKKTRVMNPGCGTSGGGWKGQECDSDLSEAARRFPKSSAPQNVAAAPGCARPDCNGCRAGRKREGG